MTTRKQRKWGCAGRRICAGALAVFGVCSAWTVNARAEEIDLSLNGPAPYTAVAPVPVYTADIDFTNPGAGKADGGPVDAVAQQVECDVTTGGSTTSDLVALILDRDATDNLIVKVQQQDGSGTFSHIGFYHGTGSGGWAGMTGGAAFFAIPASDKFTSAHMIVIHDGGGNVTLRLTNIDGGGKVLGYSRGGWTPRNSSAGGFGGWTGTYPIDNWGKGDPTDYTCDNFDRANGPLGAGWVTTDGSGAINSNAARGTGSPSSRSIFVGSCPSGPTHSAEADVTIVGTGLDYCALILNYNGANNLFIKLQQQDGGNGIFDHIGFYEGVNGGGWSGQTGGSAFFTIPDDQLFCTAHMKVTLDAGGTVRLILTNIDGGGGLREYQRGGWTLLNDTRAGFGGYNGNNVNDNFGIDDNGVCDNFNRADGPLGANWDTDVGTAAIVNHAASGTRDPNEAGTRSIFVGTCGACSDITSPLVSVTGPATFSCVCSSVTVTGSVSDPDGTYADDILEHRRIDLNTWTLAASASGPRSGNLYTWNTGALIEGYYYLRVTGRNVCNLTNSDTTLIYIGRSFDTVDMRSPPTGAILGGFVCFDGTAWDNNCFANYSLMYKPSGGGAFAPVDPNFPTYPTSIINDPLGSWNTASGPTSVPDGNYDVRLRGTDICGDNAQVIHTITVDNTAPIATLSPLLTCSSLHGVVPIIGTASDTHIAGWALQYTGGDAHSWVTIASGNSNVNNALLGTWNTNGLRSCGYVLRLVVSDSAGVNCSGNTHQTEYYVGVGIGVNLFGDMNCDGLVTFDDVDPFVDCLSGGPCGCP